MLLPEEFLSTATPGMKWSTMLLVASIGILCTPDHVVPFVEVTKTRSFVEQFARKRQSSQTTKILPSPEISADGSGPLRMFPGSAFAVIDVIVIGWPKLTPPFVETVAPSEVSLALSSGTTTFPFGSTTGWPPITPTLGTPDKGQLTPASRGHAIISWLPWPKSSQTV